jgi:dCTP deaminase
MSYGASHAGYDIRIDQDLVLEGKEFKLASASERFDMPNDVVAVVHDVVCKCSIP